MAELELDHSGVLPPSSQRRRRDLAKDKDINNHKKVSSVMVYTVKNSVLYICQITTANIYRLR